MELSELLSYSPICDAICTYLDFFEINHLRLALKWDQITLLTPQKLRHWEDLSLTTAVINEDVRSVYLKIQESGLRKALFRTIIEGNPRLLTIICEMGACQVINSFNIFGETALILAVKHNREALIPMLLEKGANINHKINRGGTSLMFAALFGFEKIVKMLVENRAELDSGTNRGQTPLMLASRKGHTSIVQYLLDQGANSNLVNYYGSTALTIAEITNRYDIQRLLLKHNKSLN